MSFCTAINCMDGRVQLPVIQYLKERFGILYVDVVSEAGPVRVLAGRTDSEPKASVVRRAGVSVSAHGSGLIAVVAHDDCAGNPVPEEQQRRELAASVGYIAGQFPEALVLGLWVDSEWSVTETCRSGTLTGAGPQDA